MESDGSESLYARILGPVWEERHPAVRQAHAASAVPRRGRFRVRRGRSAVARLLALVLRLPRPAEHSRVYLRIEVRGRVERWSRTFDGRRLVSEQREAGDGLLRETFGSLEQTVFAYRWRSRWQRTKDWLGFGR